MYRKVTILVVVLLISTMLIACREQKNDTGANNSATTEVSLTDTESKGTPVNTVSQTESNKTPAVIQTVKPSNTTKPSPTTKAIKTTKKASKTTQTNRTYSPQRTNTTEDFEDTFTVKYCRSFYEKNKAALKEIYGYLTDVGVDSITIEEDIELYHNHGEYIRDKKLPKARLDKIRKFCSDNGVECIRLAGKDMKLQYASRRYDSGDTYWYIEYVLIYIFNDKVTEEYDHLIIKGDVLYVYKLDKNWYMGIDGPCDWEKFLEHFTEEELNECVVTEQFKGMIEPNPTRTPKVS